MNAPFRLAASSYLNSAPLIWSFLHGPHEGTVEFVEAVPARCAQLLSQSEVDGVLVPENKRRENIQSIALDESSRTSATLVKVIFREFLEREPESTTRSPNLEEMLEKNDAALIIGDPGMAFPRQGLNVWDMASLWKE